jgi:serine/threonine protein kinase
MSEAPGTTSVSRPRQTTLVDRLVDEMSSAWRRGERPQAEDYFETHPELLDHVADAVRLVYEEVCLRRESGQEVTAEDLSLRFPNWAEELALVLDCHRLMESQLTPPSFPEVGDRLGEFRLIAELGRGTHGRVFLATQSALADRPVVVKITPLQACEHLSLARLQHTHIIPLHAVYDFPAQHVRALCMPFLGGATLARVLELLHGLPLAGRTGQSLLDALDAAQSALPIHLPSQGAFHRALAKASYVEAICGIGACLADGLHYAHERGLVHLDIKPSNVFLAADAQPLLLDFHVSLCPVPAGSPLPEGFGGTGPFMSPEQARAFDAAEHALPVPQAVDARSDIYSLGRLLYAALSGQDLAAGPLPPPRRSNPRVSVGLSDLIQKCLAPDPDARYADAAALAADLRRHLAHRPLQGVANRSLRERWQKWRRRRPNAPLWAGLLFALIAGGSVLAGLFLERYQTGGLRLPAPASTRSQMAEEFKPQQFQAHFHRGICAYRRGQYADAVQAFDRAVALEPTSAEAYYNRARAHAAAGSTAQALRDYDRALELAPRLGVAWLNRGALHYQEQHYRQAAADLLQALRHGADPVAAHYNLALVAVAEGDEFAAQGHLEQVLNRKPAHVAARALHEQLSGSR